MVAALAADAALEVKSRGLWTEAREVGARRQDHGGGGDSARLRGPRRERRSSAAANKPEIQLLYDPSHATEVQVVRGVLTQHVMEVVSREAMGGPSSQQLLDDALRDLDRPSGMKPADRRRCAACCKAWASGTSGQTANPQAQAAAAASACRTP